MTLWEIALAAFLLTCPILIPLTVAIVGSIRDLVVPEKPGWVRPSERGDGREVLRSPEPEQGHRELLLDAA